MEQFTNAIRKAIRDGNWFAGLLVSLCLPDICGALETPEEDVQKRYIRWFDSNLSKKYSTMFSSEDCYFFRCSCLHQGLDTHAMLSHERIHFITPPPRNTVVHLNRLNNVLQMQIDIFCEDMSLAVDDWYEKIGKNDSAIQSRIDSLIKIYSPESLKPFISFGD